MQRFNYGHWKKISPSRAAPRETCSEGLRDRSYDASLDNRELPSHRNYSTRDYRGRMEFGTQQERLVDRQYHSRRRPQNDSPRRGLEEETRSGYLEEETSPASRRAYGENHSGSEEDHHRRPRDISNPPHRRRDGEDAFFRRRRALEEDDKRQQRSPRDISNPPHPRRRSGPNPFVNRTRAFSPIREVERERPYSPRERSPSSPAYTPSPNWSPISNRDRRSREISNPPHNVTNRPWRNAYNRNQSTLEAENCVIDMEGVGRGSTSRNPSREDSLEEGEIRESPQRMSPFSPDYSPSYIRANQLVAGDGQDSSVERSGMKNQPQQAHLDMVRYHQKEFDKYTKGEVSPRWIGREFEMEEEGQGRREGFNSPRYRPPGTPRYIPSPIRDGEDEAGGRADRSPRWIRRENAMRNEERSGSPNFPRYRSPISPTYSPSPIGDGEDGAGGRADRSPRWIRRENAVGNEERSGSPNFPRYRSPISPAYSPSPIGDGEDGAGGRADRSSRWIQRENAVGNEERSGSPNFPRYRSPTPRYIPSPIRDREDGAGVSHHRTARDHAKAPVRRQSRFRSVKRTTNSRRTM